MIFLRKQSLENNAECYFKLQNYNSAIDLIKMAMELDENNSELYFHLAKNIYYRAGKCVKPE